MFQNKKDLKKFKNEMMMEESTANAELAGAEEQQSWQEQYITKFLPHRPINPEEINYIAGLLESAKLAERKRVVENIKHWIFENHAHHEFADEQVPKGQIGCENKDYPFINSSRLVYLLQNLI